MSDPLRLGETLLAFAQRLLRPKALGNLSVTLPYEVLQSSHDGATISFPPNEAE
jgi:hypothetical protein